VTGLDLTGMIADKGIILDKNPTRIFQDFVYPINLFSYMKFLNYKIRYVFALKTPKSENIIQGTFS